MLLLDRLRSLRLAGDTTLRLTTVGMLFPAMCLLCINAQRSGPQREYTLVIRTVRNLDLDRSRALSLEADVRKLLEYVSQSGVHRPTKEGNRDVIIKP